MNDILLESRNLGVLLIHGFTSSPDQMKPFGEELTKHGITCFIPMLTGHEKIPDSLTNVKNGDWFNDAERAFEQLRSKTKNVIVAGHSLGGTLSLYLAERHSLNDGLIALCLINPAIKLTVEERRAIRFGRFYQKRLGVSVKPFQVLKNTIDDVRSRLNRITVPVFMFISNKDELIPFAYQQWLFNKLNVPKYFVTLPEEGHSPSSKAAAFIINSFLELSNVVL
ncbi:alpha/beta hydrolase [Coprothermobacter platensis]|jgi:carboxylesterase|uniref:alpha/beta hydrolase n=1 Tax=Coprothermobacter platensis TaxID=108819 RepID=UPI00035E1E48|nr:alpha/beta fold hydrolase [Coprothermobacter platensis]